MLFQHVHHWTSFIITFDSLTKGPSYMIGRTRAATTGVKQCFIIFGIMRIIGHYYSFNQVSHLKNGHMGYH